MFICLRAGGVLAVTALAGGSIAMLLMSKGAGKGNIFWIIVIAIVGVIGFFFCCCSHRPPPAPTARRACSSCCGTTSA